MKRILITGVGGYIGQAVCNYLQRCEGYEVERLSVRGNDWRSRDFSGYDVIVHAAGIAHRKETRQNAEDYYAINRDLTRELAEKARAENVKQFIFLSSVSVYGLFEGGITRETIPAPKSHYGKSKLEAENILKAVDSEDFRVAILRVPMVYGKGCRGNYQSLRKIALSTPVFPKTDNKRSMIYSGNLCVFIKRLIDNSDGGLFFPQNREYVNTGELARAIALANGKHIRLIPKLGDVLRRMPVPKLKKAFGSLWYTQPDCVEEIGFLESIRKTEQEESL